MNQITAEKPKQLVSIERLGKDKFQLNFSSGPEIYPAVKATQILLEMEDDPGTPASESIRICEMAADDRTLRAIKQDILERDALQKNDNKIITTFQSRMNRGRLGNDFYLREIIILAGLLMGIPAGEHSEFNRVLECLQFAVENILTSDLEESVTDALNGVALTHI